MAEVIIINPTKPLANRQMIRVAAYVRVSSDSEDQENSFITQYDYYSNLIAGHADWACVDIYADQGISGTELAHREEFNRMVGDCEDGKIDLILTKSVSRFARNTYDCIETVRRLKALGVNVIFEKENLDTSKMTSEVELAAIGAIAQEESMSLSKNVRMGIQYRMKNGTFRQGCLPYGYYAEDGEWKINEEQARVVRVIFKAYIDGKSLKQIADELTAAGIDKGDGNAQWSEQRIGRLLRNERYKGDMLLRKTFTEDFPFRSKPNRGERDMYYVKNHHKAIVSPEMFDKANKLLDTRKKQYGSGREAKGYLLSGKIYCAECGTLYRRKSGEPACWICRSKDTKGNRCPSTQVSERTVCDGFVLLYNRLAGNAEHILVPLAAQLAAHRAARLQSGGRAETIGREIVSLTEQILVLERARAAGYLESALFMEESNRINTKIRTLKKDKKLILGTDECEKLLRKTEAMIGLLKTTGPIGEFDRKLFGKLVDRLQIDKDKNICYMLTNGLKLTIKQNEVD